MAYNGTEKEVNEVIKALKQQTDPQLIAKLNEVSGIDWSSLSIRYTFKNKQIFSHRLFKLNHLADSYLSAQKNGNSYTFELYSKREIFHTKGLLNRKFSLPVRVLKGNLHAPTNQKGGKLNQKLAYGDRDDGCDFTVDWDVTYYETGNPNADMWIRNTVNAQISACFSYSLEQSAYYFDEAYLRNVIQFACMDNGVEPVNITVDVYGNCPYNNGGILYEPPGGGGGEPEFTTNLVLTGGPIVTNLTEYLKCFNSNSNVIMTVYVDQPTPNSSVTWSGPLLDPDVGHTFISIQQGSIVRVLGFYPSTGINPVTSPATPSVIRNDSGHAYDVKIVFESVAANKVTSIIDYLKSPPSTYNLNTLNCTDFGIVAANLAGYVLPDISGTWPGGGGSNPGNLGQSLRGLSNSTNVSIVKSSGTAVSNAGTCQ